MAGGREAHGCGARVALVPPAGGGGAAERLALRHRHQLRRGAGRHEPLRLQLWDEGGQCRLRLRAMRAACALCVGCPQLSKALHGAYVLCLHACSSSSAMLQCVCNRHCVFRQIHTRGCCSPVKPPWSCQLFLATPGRWAVSGLFSGSGVVRVRGAEQEQLPLLERGGALAVQPVQRGGARQGVRAVLRDQVRGHRRPVRGARPPLPLPHYCVPTFRRRLASQHSVFKHACMA